MAAATPVAQATVGHLVDQAVDGPFPRGVELEGSSHERGAFGIKDDVGHLAAANGLADVQVAEGALCGIAPSLAFWPMPFLTSLAKLAE